MAHMYPDGGPTKSTPSPTERRLYDILRQKLDNTYHVFHSVPWSTVQKNGTVVDGEVDFIILHPEYGILLIEVKGGVISYDGPNKQWHSRNGQGILNSIKDPFLQVRESAHTLKKHLSSVQATKPFANSYWIEYAVWFPDVSWTHDNLPLMHVDDGLVLDMASRSDPEPAIQAILTRKKHKHRISPEALQAFIEVLVPKRTIKAKLRDQITMESEEFVRLREVQYQRFVLMDHFPHITVRGAAGTGKTVIALEKARRLAAQNFDVLFVCSNRSLARWLLSMVREEPKHIQDHITVRNVEQFCTELSGQANLLLNPPTEHELQKQEELGNRAFQVKLAADFTRSIHALEAEGTLPQFDAILVDEGQDFERPLWGPLYKLLRDRRNGKFIAFYDPAQREGDGDGAPAIPGGDVHELLLSENCRNTRAIFDVAQEFYHGDELPACVGPVGQEVVWFDPATRVDTKLSPDEREIVALETVLNILVGGEGISPREILVVVGRSQKGSAVYRRHSLGSHLLSNNTAIRDPGVIRVTTIRSVKGLESPVVILAELDGIQSVQGTQPLTYRRYMYIATSRAVHQLIVLSVREKALPLQQALL